jgi:hypothetical protein
MQLTISLRFNHYDATEIDLAITPKQVKLPKEEFLKLILPALELIHHNAQSYGVLAEALAPRAPYIGVEGQLERHKAEWQ